MSKKSLRTGEVAARAGVSVATLRYYERRGLIPEPARTAGGFREYPPETVDVLRLIQRAKELGFTLREIRKLEELRRDPNATCGDFHELATRKQRDLEEQLRFLQRSRDILEDLVKSCPCAGRHPARECRVLSFLLKEEPLVG